MRSCAGMPHAAGTIPVPAQPARRMPVSRCCKSLSLSANWQSVLAAPRLSRARRGRPLAASLCLRDDRNWRTTESTEVNEQSPPLAKRIWSLHSTSTSPVATEPSMPTANHKEAPEDYCANGPNTPPFAPQCMRARPRTTRISRVLDADTNPFSCSRPRVRRRAMMSRKTDTLDSEFLLPATSPCRPTTHRERRQLRRREGREAVYQNDPVP